MTGLCWAKCNSVLTLFCSPAQVHCCWWFVNINAHSPEWHLLIIPSSLDWNGGFSFNLSIVVVNRRIGAPLMIVFFHSPLMRFTQSDHSQIWLNWLWSAVWNWVSHLRGRPSCFFETSSRAPLNIQWKGWALKSSWLKLTAVFLNCSASGKL